MDSHPSNVAFTQRMYIIRHKPSLASVISSALIPAQADVVRTCGMRWHDDGGRPAANLLHTRARLASPTSLSSLATSMFEDAARRSVGYDFWEVLRRNRSWTLL